MLYELCTMNHPFDGTSMENLLKNIVKSPYHPLSRLYSVELRKLLDSCLQKQPDKRPTITQILKLSLLQPYIKQYKSVSQPIIDNVVINKTNENNDNNTNIHSNNIINNKALPIHLPSIVPTNSQAPSPRYILNAAQPSHGSLNQLQPKSPRTHQQSSHPSPRIPLNAINAQHPRQITPQQRQLTPLQQQQKQQLHKLKEYQRINQLHAVRNSSPSNVNSSVNHNYSSMNRLQSKREQERIALENELAQIRAKYMAEQKQSRYTYNSIQQSNDNNTHSNNPYIVNQPNTRYGRTPQVQSTVMHGSRYASPGTASQGHGIASVQPVRKHHFV